MADTEVAVQAALAQIGKPYSQAYLPQADDPNPEAFDCSSLVQWSFAQAGIKTSRTTYTQIFEGEKVSGSPQRGDIVFPDGGHVMIALGGDSAVHAPTFGEFVEITNYWQAPMEVRRLGTNTGSPGATESRFGGAGEVKKPDNWDQMTDEEKAEWIVKNENLGGKVIGGAQDGLDKIMAPLNAMNDLTKWLSEGKNWKRILLVYTGIILVVIAVAILMWRVSKELTAIGEFTGDAKKATGFNTGDLPGAPMAKKVNAKVSNVTSITKKVIK